MKVKLFDSIRIKLVMAVILSMICVLITDCALFGVVFAVKKISLDSSNKQITNNSGQNSPEAPPIEEGDMEGTTMDGIQPLNPEGPRQSQNAEAGEAEYTFTFRMRHGGLIFPDMWMDTLLIIFISLILFVAYYLVFTNKFIGYFGEINTGIERIKNGDFQSDIKVRGSNELSMIAESINDMRLVLKANIESERNAEQMKNELITSVAHDLRTPLTSTIGYLELLYRDQGLAPEVRDKYIEVSYKKAKTLEQLINELFDFTRFQKGKMKLAVSDIDITMFLQQMMEEFSPMVEDAGLKLITDIPTTPLMIEGDGEKLARVFSNLLANAVKYGADGKLIKLALIDLEEQVYINITNYGKVIPQDKLPYIFDKFYRVEASRSTNTGGTGLGLAIAKNIVLMHGGEISAKSDENGTVFAVCLPKQHAMEVETTPLLPITSKEYIDKIHSKTRR